MENLENDIREQVVEYVKNLPSGKIFTIVDIARNTKHAPQTISKYLPLLLIRELLEYVDLQKTDNSRRYMVRR